MINVLYIYLLKRQLENSGCTLMTCVLFWLLHFSKKVTKTESPRTLFPGHSIFENTGLHLHTFTRHKAGGSRSSFSGAPTNGTWKPDPRPPQQAFSKLCILHLTGAKQIPTVFMTKGLDFYLFRTHTYCNNFPMVLEFPKEVKHKGGWSQRSFSQNS